MLDLLENPNIVSSFKGPQKKWGRVEKRKTNGFVFVVKGEREYSFDDGGRVIRVNSGEVIFIPANSSYEYKVSSESDPEYVSVNFTCEIKDAVPTLYSLEGFSDAENITKRFYDMWRGGTPYDRFKCFSLFYSLLSHISVIEHTDYSDKHKSRIIEPAVKYMREHMSDSSLSADTLHLLCGVSDTYFRRIFFARFGMTPKKYITSKRMSLAKAIIESGDFESVSEVAYSVGYSDPLYFSRVFKAHFGDSPTGVK